MPDSVPVKGSHYPAVMIRGLNFSYDGYLVLEDVNIEIQQGDFVSVVGPNGGGKTTLIKLILGLLTPSSGAVKVFGQDPDRARTRMGYMPQHSQLDFQFPATVMDVTLMGRLGHGSHFGFYSREDREIVLTCSRKGWVGRNSQEIFRRDLRRAAPEAFSGKGPGVRARYAAAR